MNRSWILLLGIGLQLDFINGFESCPGESSTLLLQTGLKLGDEKLMPPPSSHLAREYHLVVEDQDMKMSIEAGAPVYYFHVPKTGGTPFTRALLLTSGLCPNMSDEDVELVKTHDGSDGGGVYEYLSVAVEVQCKVADLRFAGMKFSDHSGVGAYYQHYVAGHGFTMMRQPEQRIMSGYISSQHSWSLSIFGRDAHNVSEYAQVVAGCAVKMLTRTAASTWDNNYTVCGDPHPVTSDETDLAVKRLQGFAFVGLVESWDLSICLLHAKFGGSCTSYELEEGHVTEAKNTTWYDTSELDGFVDLADGRMYDEAHLLFQNDLQKYGVTVDSCSECFAQARIVASASQAGSITSKDATFLQLGAFAAEQNTGPDAAGGNLQIHSGLSAEPVTPIYWLHVPKTGGTPFGQALVFLPGVCEHLSEEDRLTVLNGTHAESSVLSQDLESSCKIADMRFAGYLFGDHSGVGGYYSQYVKGHAFTMLRQPEQRIISGYGNEFHSWPYPIYGRDPLDLVEYAQVVAGCTAKMLTRTNSSTWLTDRLERYSVCGDPSPVTASETDLAVKRLVEGFVFVGILESWDLSICLLHAKFGGQCQSNELEAGHTAGNSTTEYDTRQLQGFTDVVDRRMYYEGKRMFEQDLQKYGVTVESCSACFAQKQ